MAGRAWLSRALWTDSHARERAKDIQRGAYPATDSVWTRCRGRGVVRNEAGGPAGATPGRSFSVLLGVGASSVGNAEPLKGFKQGSGVSGSHLMVLALMALWPEDEHTEREKGAFGTSLLKVNVVCLTKLARGAHWVL